MLAPTSAAAASARADVGLIKRREGRKKKIIIKILFPYMAA